MKKIFTMVICLITTVVMAQNNLFSNISTTDQYTEYSSVKDSGGGGIYVIKNKYAIVKFQTEYLPTGEGYKIKIIVDNEGAHKGKTRFLLDATTENTICKGQPYESVLTNSKNYKSFVAIGDYVFVLYGAEDGVSFTKIDRVFIKKGAVSPKTKGKKKKRSFKERLLALKAMKSGGVGFGPEHKALQKQNLKKMITDYLVAMKAKQDARTSTELKSEKNVKIAQKKGIAKETQREKDEWAEAKRYNDSVKATPEWKDLQRRKEQNERNYQSSKARNKVTLRNNSKQDIYVGKSGSYNPGTKVRAGGTALWDCSYSAYTQTISSTGGYKSSKNKVYRANSGCGKTITIR